MKNQDSGSRYVNNFKAIGKMDKKYDNLKS